MIRFGRRGKLGPRYIGPFPVEERIGEIVYRLELPASLVGVHPVFHVSQLQRCIGDQIRHMDFSQDRGSSKSHI